MSSQPPFGPAPTTRLVFPTTEADYQAVLTRLRQGIPYPAELLLEESTPELAQFCKRCEADLGRTFSTGQVAEAIRVAVPQAEPVASSGRQAAEPHAPANAAGQVERPGTSSARETPVEAKSSSDRPLPREIPARPASVEDLPTFEPEPVKPNLLRETLLGAAAGVAVGLFSRKLGAAILGWTALRFVIHHYAPIPADEMDEVADEATDASPSDSPAGSDEDDSHDD